MWGAIALDRPEPDDVDRALDRGCVGISLPAGALAGSEELLALRSSLDRLEAPRRAAVRPPGPGPRLGAGSAAGGSLREPLWWPALTDYVAGLQAAWLAFQAVGPARPSRVCAWSSRRSPGSLRCTPSGSRLAAGPVTWRPTRCSSTRPPPTARSRSPRWSRSVGSRQLLYGSDRPVLEPSRDGSAGRLDWDLLARSRVARSASRPGWRRCERARRALPRLRRPDPFAMVPRPRAATSTGPSCEAFVAELAERPELWIERVRHDPTQRSYEELIADAHPHGLADLLDGRPRHRLPRPRPLLGRRRGRQRRGPRGAPHARRRAAQPHVQRRAELPLLRRGHPPRPARRRAIRP